MESHFMRYLPMKKVRIMVCLSVFLFNCSLVFFKHFQNTCLPDKHCCTTFRIISSRWLWGL